MRKILSLFAGTAIIAGYFIQAPTTEAAPAAPEVTLSIPAQEQAGDCPTENFIDVATYVQTQNYPSPTVSVSCDGTTMTVRSNGIPNYEFVQITPNALKAQDYAWQIPQHPAIAASPTDIPLLGGVGIVVNGMPIYGPNEAADLGWGDPYLDQILDYCNGHTGPNGDYHYHAPPVCLFEEYDGQVGLVIGYAFDGFPIMAPYVCEDTACTTVKEVRSSWVRTADVQEAWKAHEYIEGSGDLDRCNGMMDSEGNYRYYATNSFPYFLGCYVGTPSTSSGIGAHLPGGQNGAPPNNGGQPPNGQNGAPPNNGGQPPNGQNGAPPPGGQPPNGGPPPPPRN